MHLDEATSAYIWQVFELLSQFTSLCPQLDLRTNLTLDQTGRSIEFGLVLVQSSEHLDFAATIFLFDLSPPLMNPFLR